MSNKLPYEKLNDFVHDVINPVIVKSEDICKADGILDWLMQKSWSHSLTYQSWPDGETHTVNEGLKQVFDLIQNLDASLRQVIYLYNQELYGLYYNIDKAESKEAIEALNKLNKIKEIL